MKHKFNYEHFNRNNFGAGITATAGTRLALQLVLVKDLQGLGYESCIVIFSQYLLELGVGNLRACCLP